MRACSMSNMSSKISKFILFLLKLLATEKRLLLRCCVSTRLNLSSPSSSSNELLRDRSSERYTDIFTSLSSIILFIKIMISPLSLSPSQLGGYLKLLNGKKTAQPQVTRYLLNRNGRVPLNLASPCLLCRQPSSSEIQLPVQSFCSIPLLSAYQHR